MEQAVNKGGRPRKVIDYDAAEELGALHCTQEECAPILGCSIAVLERDLEFRARHKAGKARANASLRRKQFELAINKGNVTMLVWLGKQVLGQTEKQSLRITNEYQAMTREELEAIVLGETIEGTATQAITHTQPNHTDPIDPPETEAHTFEIEKCGKEVPCPNPSPAPNPNFLPPENVASASVGNDNLTLDE